jgi:hypothetical protein
MTDPAITAASDQAHAEAEHTLNKLIGWWREKNGLHNLAKSDQVAILTYILTTSAPTTYAALLATAINRLADKDTP